MKKVFIIICLFVFAQGVAFAQIIKANKDGVVAELQAYNTSNGINGCMLQNNNDYPVVVTYTIKFIIKVGDTDPQEVYAADSIKLLPAGTPKSEKGSAKYWVPAGSPYVIADRTIVSITVAKYS